MSSIKISIIFSTGLVPNFFYFGSAHGAHVVLLHPLLQAVVMEHVQFIAVELDYLLVLFE